MKVKLIVIIAYIIIGIIMGVQGLIKLKKNGVSSTPTQRNNSCFNIIWLILANLRLNRYYNGNHK